MQAEPAGASAWAGGGPPLGAAGGRRSAGFLQEAWAGQEGREGRLARQETGSQHAPARSRFPLRGAAGPALAVEGVLEKVAAAGRARAGRLDCGSPYLVRV